MHCLGHWQLIDLQIDANGWANRDLWLAGDLYREIMLVPRVSLLRKVMLTSAIQLEGILTYPLGTSPTFP